MHYDLWPGFVTYLASVIYEDTTTAGYKPLLAYSCLYRMLLILKHARACACRFRKKVPFFEWRNV